MRKHSLTRRAGLHAGCLVAALFFATSAGASCDANIRITRPDSRYEAVAGAMPAGSEVRDKVTGLIWQRCPLGMAWDGSVCAGTALALTWAESLEAARTAVASRAPGAGWWRLPSITELVSLIDTACLGPATNSTWFTSSHLVWSSSPFLAHAPSAWIVNLNQGETLGSPKGSKWWVLLVRAGQ
ncbi:MAG: DUF1566 domain-containing protein [Burkholderiales bacterium]|nr:DUF1566 domain-containing protein [Burkholderiales bacterium]